MITSAVTTEGRRNAAREVSRVTTNRRSDWSLMAELLTRTGITSPIDGMRSLGLVAGVSIGISTPSEAGILLRTFARRIVQNAERSGFLGNVASTYHSHDP